MNSQKIRSVTIILMLIFFGLWLVFVAAYNNGTFVRWSAPLPHIGVKIPVTENQWLDFVSDWPYPVKLRYPAGWSVAKDSKGVKFQSSATRENVYLYLPPSDFTIDSDSREDVTINGLQVTLIKDSNPVDGSPVDYVVWDIPGDQVLVLRGHGPLFDAMSRSVELLILADRQSS